LHLAGRTSEALEAIREAEALAESSEERCWSAELHRLRGLFLATLGAEALSVHDPVTLTVSSCFAIGRSDLGHEFADRISLREPGDIELPGAFLGADKASVP
jgi:hypothetical protein